jgi:hypothetical protein
MEGTPFEDFFETHVDRIGHRSCQRAFRSVKLSVEAKVAAAVAIAFASVTIGVVAQEGSEHGSARLSQTKLQGSEISSSIQNVSSESPVLAQY